jgi:hypothetical protein
MHFAPPGRRNRRFQTGPGQLFEQCRSRKKALPESNKRIPLTLTRSGITGREARPIR